jgi:hypothetical protein
MDAVSASSMASLNRRTPVMSVPPPVIVIEPQHAGPECPELCEGLLRREPVLNAGVRVQTPGRLHGVLDPEALVAIMESARGRQWLVNGLEGQTC